MFENLWDKTPDFNDLGSMICENGEYVEMYCFKPPDHSWKIGAIYGERPHEYFSGRVDYHSFEGSYRDGYPIFEAYKAMIRAGLDVPVPKRVELLEEYKGIPAGTKMFLQRVKMGGYAECVLLANGEPIIVYVENSKYKEINDDWTKPFVYEED